MDVLLGLPQWDWCQMLNISRIKDHGSVQGIIDHDTTQGGLAVERLSRATRGRVRNTEGMMPSKTYSKIKKVAAVLLSLHSMARTSFPVYQVFAILAVSSRLFQALKRAGPRGGNRRHPAR